MKKLYLVAGARPNFMKIAPIVRELARHRDRFHCRIVHTGQHYDREMSDVFFEELEIPQPDFHLEVGSGSHAEQTARVMTRFEKICLQERPALVMVVGDVNSTLACSIVAKKLHIEVAHVEAGLRSGDMSMPEEVNRIVTDSITDHFFVTEQSGVDNLLREGKPKERIHFVGHVMIDNLFHQVRKLESMDTAGMVSTKLKRRFKEYGVVTLHRPSNVDHADTLRRIIAALTEVSRSLPLVFAVHPRTSANLEKFGIVLPQTIHRTAPLPYMDFLNLFKDARVLLTDSGGVQEETTALGVPCVTLRENTERPVTVTEGTNIIVGSDYDKIIAAAKDILAGNGKAGRRPALWDGRAAERIVGILTGAPVVVCAVA